MSGSPAAATPAVKPTPEAVQQAFQLMTGHIVASAVNIAARLGLSDRLAGGPRSADDLARETGVNADALYRLMRALAGLGVFEEQAARTFALTPVGAAMCDGPVRWMAIGEPLRFDRRLRAGDDVIEIHDDALHRRILLQDRAEQGAVAAGHVHQRADAAEIVGLEHRRHDERAEAGHRVVEDPGQLGVLREHLERAVAARRDRHRRFAGLHRVHRVGVDAEIEFAGDPELSAVPGDFFTAVPAGGDAYIMKHIIHDWYDDKASLILANIRKVLPKHGRVILIESVIPPGNEPSMGKLMDLEMLVMPGGKERTEEEFRTLFERSGFTLTRTVPTRSPLSVIEARPR